MCVSEGVLMYKLETKRRKKIGKNEPFENYIWGISLVGCVDENRTGMRGMLGSKNHAYICVYLCVFGKKSFCVNKQTGKVIRIIW